MSAFFDPFRSLINEPFGQQFGSGLAAGGDAGLYPDTENLLAWYRTDIIDSKLRAYLPPSSHTTQQVKSSGFSGAGSALVTGLTTAHTFTATGDLPTCTVNGTLTFPGPDCCDVRAFLDGVLWAYWPGVNVGQTTELDASGNGHHLTGLVGTTITERVDGSGTNYANEVGYSVADGATHYGSADTSFLLPIGTRFTIGYEPSGTIPSNIGPYPMPDPEPLATPDWYVDSAATGTGDGLSWANAKTTLALAHTAASAGDVIEVSGGAAGKTYTTNFDVSKGVVVQGSKTAGHSGLVTIDGRIRTTHTAGVAKFINIKHKFTFQEFINPLLLGAAGETQWIDVQFYPWDIYTSPPTISGGKHTFSRSKFHKSFATNKNSRPLYLTAAAELYLNYCVFDHAGCINSIPAGSTVGMNKCVVLGTGAALTESFLDIGNSAATTINVSDSIFFGVHPIKSGASSKAPVVTNCYYHGQPKATSIKTFDTSNKSVVTGSIASIDPEFTTPKNDSIGDLVIRFDDRNNLDISVADAAALNPEIKVSHYVDIHSAVSQTRPTALEIDTMRALIADGNEIGCHGATHSNLSTLSAFTISATGTSPTLTIAGTRTGDSSMWTGTLSVTINGVTEGFDLTTYPTLVSIITVLHGNSVGDGVVTCTKYITAGAVNSDYMLSLCLANVTAQSISTAHIAVWDDTAYNRFEVTESILDLEAYVNTGSDRNGSNAITGTTIDPPSPAYVCKTYCTAYGTGRASVEALLKDNSNIVGAAAANGTTINDGVMYKYGDPVNLYEFTSTQMNIPNVDDETFAIAARCCGGPNFVIMLFHGTGPTFGGTIAGFKTLLQTFGLGSKTFSEYMEFIRTDGAWAITEPNAAFTGDSANYLSQGDYTLLPSSPLLDAGTPEIY